MKRYGYSATVLSSTPTSVEILVFGGCTRRTNVIISATTLLILSELLLYYSRSGKDVSHW